MSTEVLMIFSNPRNLSGIPPGDRLRQPWTRFNKKTKNKTSEKQHDTSPKCSCSVIQVVRRLRTASCLGVFSKNIHKIKQERDAGSVRLDCCIFWTLWWHHIRRHVLFFFSFFFIFFNADVYRVEFFSVCETPQLKMSRKPLSGEQKMDKNYNFGCWLLEWVFNSITWQQQQRQRC